MGDTLGNPVRRKGPPVRFPWLIVILTIVAVPTAGLAVEQPPASVLILDQSGPGLPWYGALTSALRSVLNRSSTKSPSIYVENLDLNRFNGPRYDQSLKNHLQEKYRAKPISVVIAIGAEALQFVLRARSDMDSLSGVPVIFAAVDEATARKMSLPPDVTGSTIRLDPGAMLATARALVPGLKRIAQVGGSAGRSTLLRPFDEARSALPAELELIDLTGLPMTEIRQRVASLPDLTVIFYNGLSIDGAGASYIPADALALVSEVANRPIVVELESYIGRGAVGGRVISAVPIGEEAARLALRIIGGESPLNIPVTAGDFIKPVFDWRELNRWNISEKRLPPGSELRFRRPTLWEQYRWHVITVLALVLIQAAVITGLYFERRRRRRAEVELRGRLAEVIHLNRVVTAGALSASFAHELNQPLGAIQSNAEAAELYLKADPPNLEQVEMILADIRRDDRRAAEIIGHMGGLLRKRKASDLQVSDFNHVIRDAFQILDPEASKRGVKLSVDQTKDALPVRVDQIHLQQVILNLAVNGMDAMRDCAPGAGKISIQTALVGSSAIEVSVADSGIGIPPDKLKYVFDTFYTTKRQGTGLGLSIARTIIETYGGKIWAENRPGGGAVVRFTLPLSEAVAA
jgi:signal transduction histidine kinase